MGKESRIIFSIILKGDSVVNHNILDILKNINNQNKKFKDWKNKNLYKLLTNKELLKLAYNNIKSKPGSMTPNSDGITLDGISENWFDGIITNLREGTFQFKPSRIKEIPKTSGGLRKIAIPSPRDKIVQEAMRLILEAIYEPTMKDESHGFRPGRSCHTALNDVRYKWPGVEWFLEIDIKNFFDSIDHHILVSILSNKISDDRFIQLIWKYLKAGYLENFIYKNSIAGTPQGSTIGPILSNIFLDQVDSYIYTLREKYETGKRKPVNPEYIRIRELKDPTIKEKLKASFILSGKSYTLRETDKFIRIKFVRYADDLLVGVYGSIDTANKIYQKIINKLTSLKLEINHEKSCVVSSYNPIKFLGTLVNARKPAKVIKGNRVLPTGSITVKCDINSIIQRLHKNGFCNKSGFPICCNKLINLTLEEIVIKFNYVLRGLINYFNPTDNFYNFGRIQYILQYSCAKTLAGKLRLSMPQVFRKFSKNLKVSEKVHMYLHESFAAKKKWKNVDDFSIDIYAGTQRMIFIGEKCVICGSSENLLKHHIRKINRKAKRTWEKFMGMINRKQITVCAKCHSAIHHGNYDSIPLSNLVNS